MKTVDMLEKLMVINARDPTHILYRFTRREKTGYLSLLKKSGVTATRVDVSWPDDNFLEFAEGVTGWFRRVKSFGSEKAVIVKKIDDILEAKKTGKVSFILSSQGTSMIGNDASKIAVITEMGIRMLELTYQSRNLVGDGCGEKTDCGLSKFGLDVIHEMNEQGIVVDLSHTGYRTSLEAMEVSEAPVVFSHSNVAALYDHPRNLTDEQINLIADKGGVIGISAYAPLLLEKGGEKRASVNDMVDHMEYIIKLVGVEHVGIGLDVGESRTKEEGEIIHELAGVPGKAPKYRYVTELTSISGLPKLIEALAGRGYSQIEIEKILGKNFLRVFNEVWRQ